MPPPPLRHQPGFAGRPESAYRLERAIAWAELSALCLRGALPVLAALGRGPEGAQRLLDDAERRAATLRGRRDLMLVSRTRRGGSP